MPTKYCRRAFAHLARSFSVQNSRRHGNARLYVMQLSLDLAVCYCACGRHTLIKLPALALPSCEAD